MRKPRNCIRGRVPRHPGGVRALLLLTVLAVLAFAAPPMSTAGAVLPEGPTLVTVSAMGDGDVDLQWNNPVHPDFSATRIVRKAGGPPAGPSDGVIVYEGTGTSHVDWPLPAGETLYYAAYSTDGGGEWMGGSGGSALVTDGVLPPPVEAPNSAAWDEGSNSVTLSWALPATGRFTGVRVLRRTDTTPTAFGDPMATVVDDRLTTSAEDPVSPRSAVQTAHYYALYVHDLNGNSTPVTFSVTIPAGGAPALSASVDRGTVPYGGSATVTGVMRLGTAPLADQDLVLQHSPVGTSVWTDVETRRSDANGEVTATVNPVDKSRYRWNYAGSGENAPATSSAVRVSPGVFVSTPNLPTMAIVGRTYRAYGYLKPRHPAGSNHVRIQVLRKSGGVWVVYRTYAARNSDYSSYTKYTKSMSLPRGFWRLKAYTPVDSKHVATYSGTKSVTVGASYLAYRGLGAWVDIFDDRAFDHPESAVRDMAAHGVRTLYVETSNSSRSYAIHRPSRMRRLIRAAHAKKMRVVAWYLPDLTSTSRDYSRVKQAIRFRTSDGQRFDSFALDIESSKVRSVSTRNRRLLYLSSKIRRLVGPKYPLGAIIPSPVGIQRARGYWPRFPYSDLAKTYDAFVPMSYYTYHGNGAAAAYDDTIGNVTILRSQRNCVAKPIHLIGGLASGSSALELRSFVRASQETTCQGASLYDWQSTTSRHWTELKAVKPR